jgi:hypothetical protein
MLRTHVILKQDPEMDAALDQGREFFVTCEPLPPGIYRVHQDGTIQHVTKVIVHGYTPYPMGLLAGGSIGTLLALVFIAYLMHRRSRGY